MLFTKDEIINISVGFVAGVGATLLTEYIYKQVKSKKNKPENDIPAVNDKELKEVKLDDNADTDTDAATDNDIVAEENDEPISEEQGQKNVEFISSVLRNIDTNTKIRKKATPLSACGHPLSALRGLLFENDIYWIDEDCYHCCQTSTAKRQGAFWCDSITKRPAFNGWTDLSYIYLPSTGNFYVDGEDGPSPEPLSDTEKDILTDNIGTFATDLVTENYSESESRVETAVDTDDGTTWAWDPDVYLIDVREGREGLYHFRTMEKSFTEDEYIDYCKEFVDDPADWYAQYGLTYGEF